MRIAVVDYCKGNLRSVQKGLEAVGGEAFITMDPAEVAVADAVVLPGVGAFADASETMTGLGLMDAVADAIGSGRPFLGICLGMHLMLDEGEEGGVDGVLPRGLGVIPGTCRRLPQVSAGGAMMKIPHVGWNTVDFAHGDGGPLFAGIPDGSHFYFTHSYACVPDDADDIVATTTHGDPFVSVVERDNAYGLQFHPEKSSKIGLKLLDNFVHAVCGQA